MNADRLTVRHQQGIGRRFLLAEIAAGALALVLLLALYFAAPPSASRSLEQLPPTAIIAAGSTPAEIQRAPSMPKEFRSSEATFHEDADLKNVPAEPDPSSRAVAAYGN